LQAWLSTRKSKYTLNIMDGQLTRPGLNQTSGFKTDRNWFRFALIIEILAITITIYSGIRRFMITGNSKILFGSIGVVAAFIILDIVGAIWAHKNAGTKKLMENKLIYYPATNYPAIKLEGKKGIGLAILGAFLIVISALLKIGALLLLGNLNIMFYVIFSLFYMIVIYVHIYHTGYFIAETSVARNVNKENLAYSKSVIIREGQNPDHPIEYSADEYTVHLNPPIEINFPPNESKLYFGDNQVDNRHVLRFDKNLNSSFLDIHGIILDKDIQEICQTQSNPEVIKYLSVELLRLQVILQVI